MVTGRAALLAALVAIVGVMPARAEDDPFWIASGRVAPELWPAFAVLADHGADTVLRLYEAQSVNVHYAVLPPGRDGRTVIESGRDPTIVLSASWATTDPKAQATILVHEATHMYDLLGGQLARDPEGCVDNEIRAFSEQANAWQALYGPHGKSEPTSQLDAALNSLLADWRHEPRVFRRSIRRMYAAACGLE
jgi:hypothetical protein